MTAITHGADISKLENLASDLDAALKAVNSTVNQLTSDVKGLKWDGEDATKYKSVSTQQLTTASNRVEAALRSAAAKLRQNAADQRRATNADAGVAGSTGGTIAPDEPPAPGETPEATAPNSTPTPGTPAPETPETPELPVEPVDPTPVNPPESGDDGSVG